MDLSPEVILEQNCAALGRWLPGVAERVRREADDPAWRRVVGRDGTATFQKIIDAGTVEWLGGTSMPMASAQALIETMTPGETSGLGIGIGTGFEWLELLKTIAPGRTLVVLELDAGRVRRVLQMCDLSAAMAAGRLLIVIGESAGAELRGLLERCTGFEPPRVMHPLPTVIGVERAKMLAAGEVMVRDVVLLRHEQLTRAAVAVRGVAAWDGVLVLAPEPTDRWDGALVRSAAREGIETILIDHPDKASLGSWLEAIARVRPAMVRTTLFRAHFEGLLPAEVRVETWLPAEGVGSNPNLLAACRGVAGADRMVAQRTADVETLRAAGVQGEIVVMSPVVKGAGGGKSRGTGRRLVAFVCDRLAYDTESCELTLPSHAAVWNAACERVMGQPSEVQPGMGKQILQGAEQKSGVALRDEMLEQSLERGIEWLLLRGARVEALAKLIAGWGIGVKLIGAGWAEMGEVAGITWCERPVGEGESIWDDVGVLVHLERGVSAAVVEASGAGVRVVVDRTTGDVDDARRVLGDGVVVIEGRRVREQLMGMVGK